MKQDILYNSLKELGLNDFEAELYITILKRKDPTITAVAAKLQVERLTVYRGLKNIEKAGLMGKKSGNSHQIPLAPPSQIVSLLKYKQKSVKNLADNLAEELPELLSDYYQTTYQPRIRVFETKEGFITFLDELVKEATDGVYTIGSPNLLAFMPEEMEIYIQNRRHRKLISKHLAFRSSVLAGRNQKEDLREVKWLPLGLSAEAAVLVYGNKVAIWNTLLPRIVLIEDKQMHDLFKIIFDLMWQSA